MSSTLRDRLANVHPQMLRASSDRDPQKLAEARRAAIGDDVERALALLGLTKQEAAHALGYRDAGVISRWCSGIERPQFDKLFALEGFEDAWLVVLAKRNPRMAVRTVIEIRESA